MGSFTWRRIFLALNLGLSASTVDGSQLSPRACTRTVKANQGDTCASLSNAQGISVSQFLLDNPTVTSCDLTAGSDYCIAVDGTSSAPSPSPTPSLVISTDGTCGNGVTCTGSKSGTCCSEHGYCGSTNDYCTGGCQAAFGTCGAVSSSTSSGPITQPPTGTRTVWVTATTVVTSTAVTSSTRYTTIAVPGTVTSLVFTTSTVTQTASSIALTTSTAIVTATSLVTRTASSIALTTSTAIVTATNMVQVTATTIVTATSVVTRTASSTAIVTYTSLVFATSTSLVFETSTRVTTSTSLVVKTATSLVLGTSTVTVTADQTVATTTIVSGACSPTKPDTPITITRSTTSGPPTQTASDVPNPVFPGTISNCKKYYQIRDGDTCQSIIGSNGITYAQFYAWNPSVSCDSLWKDYYVCVGA